MLFFVCTSILPEYFSGSKIQRFFFFWGGGGGGSLVQGIFGSHLKREGFWRVFMYYPSRACPSPRLYKANVLVFTQAHQIYHSPIDRAIISFSGFGVIFILSTMDLMGLNVVLAVTEAGMCHLLLFAVDIIHP